MALNGGGDGGNMTDRVVNSAMKYRTQVAFVDGLMKDLGLPIENHGQCGRAFVPQFYATAGETDGQRPRKLGKSGKDDD